MTDKHRSLSFMSFWSINDELVLNKLEKQLQELKAAGLDGVVFHPRYYPDKPEYLGKEYMAVVNALILFAKSIQMKFWLYDENGWPSGTAGGEVLRRHPELRDRRLEIIEDGMPGLSDKKVLCSFRLNEGRVESMESGCGKPYSIAVTTEKMVSALDPEACKYFMEITHEGYKKGLSPEAFEYIEGFFSDEVAFSHTLEREDSYNSVPWTDDLPERYKELYGEDIHERLPLIFAKGEGYAAFRSIFWELLTDSIINAFYKPINTWCKTNKKQYTAHLKGEESPFFQIRYSGSCMQVLKNITVPAIDCLERYPGNDYYPGMLSSVSAQYGSGKCLAECMGGSGWGIKPENMVDYLLWLAGHGINNFVFHINQFRLKTSSIRDWPPSMPCHLNWRDVFPQVLAAVREKALEKHEAISDDKLLIVTPTRGIMSEFEPSEARHMNKHDGSNIPETIAGKINGDFMGLVQKCYAAGMDYEFTEERALENVGKVSGGYLELGNRKYKKVMLSKGCRWSTAGEKILKAMKEDGILPLDEQMLETICDSRDKFSEDSKRERHITLPKQTPWEIHMPEENLLLLEFEEAGQKLLTSVLRIEGKALISRFELVLLDSVKSLSIDGKPIERTVEDNEYKYRIWHHDLSEDSTEHKVAVEIEPGGEKRPVVFVRGLFRAVSLSPYLDGDRMQVKTRGPFVIKPASGLDGSDLILSGLPFCRKQIRCSKTFELSGTHKNASISLSGVNADAARIFIDGTDLGWCWGPGWTTGKTVQLDAGIHYADISIIPSTYNVYGPHRLIGGDRHLISPAQYEGAKNFADKPDAPDNTRGEYWNFVKSGIYGELAVSEKGCDS